MDTAINVIDAVVNFALGLPNEVWAGIFGAIGITALIETLKAKFATFINKHATFIGTVLSVLVSIATLGTQFVADNPALFGTAASAILGFVHFAYHFPVIGIKALHRTFSEFKDYKQAKATATIEKPATEPTAQPDGAYFAY